MQRWFALIVCAAGLALGPPSRGEAPADAGISRTPDGRAVLHRRVPGAGGGAPGEAPIFVYDPVSGGVLPQEFHRDGQALTRPAAGAEAHPGEAVYGPEGVREAAPETFGASPAGTADASLPSTPAAPGELPAAGASAEGPGGDAAAPFDDPRMGLGDIARPDRVTGGEEQLDYRTVFDPSIVPYKRNRALDKVGADYALRVERRGFTRVTPVGNRLTPAREAFWGSVLLEGAAGRRIPLPSVSPESHILSFEAAPPVGLTFERDGADNFYVTPDAAGRFRLVFVMDAPTRYFGGQIPTGRSVRDVPANLRPRVPAAIAREALDVARRAGVDPAAPYDVVINGLVSYFRGFAPGEPPESTASVYRDLALGRRGVCRHRGYAFVVTAQALGIPARYVFNEAHVFAEVYVPGDGGGWVRVDLGGGAERLVVHGSDDKTLHQPRVRDPFERPDSYARDAAAGRTAGATVVEGLPPASRRGSSAGGGGGRVDPEALPEAIRAVLDRAIPRADTTRVRPGRLATRTTLAFDAAYAYRGDPLPVRGRVVDTRGAPVSAGSVRVLLLYGRSRQAVALLGTALVDREGRYAAEVRIPETQPPGDYQIVAEYGGEGPWAPSISE